MKIIGIDYSMNSVGVCVKTDPNKYSFHAVVNTASISSAKSFSLDINGGFTKNVLESLDSYFLVTRKPYKKNKNKNKLEELNNWHDELMIGADNLSSKVMEIVKPYLDDDVLVVMENYITRNGGDTTVQIIEFTRDFKTKLFQTGLSPKIISAPEIKMFAGKGSYQKADMFEAFCSKNIDSKFSKFCENNRKNIIKSAKDLVKPVDDVIDSYFAIEAFIDKIDESQTLFD